MTIGDYKGGTMVDVALRWNRIDWRPGDTWKKQTLPKLIACGLKDFELRRSVYVIRLNGDYCIHYRRGQSPTVYIGEGRFSQRINSHRLWIKELEDLVKDFSFQIRIAVPRVRNSQETYRDCEAALLERFGHKFGSVPLWNKQFETRLFNNYNYNEIQMDQAICKGKGTKYKWELKPMKASRFYWVWYQGRA
jgi:hypothetical protein